MCVRGSSHLSVEKRVKILSYKVSHNSKHRNTTVCYLRLTEPLDFLNREILCEPSRVKISQRCTGTGKTRTKLRRISLPPIDNGPFKFGSNFLLRHHSDSFVGHCQSCGKCSCAKGRRSKSRNCTEEKCKRASKLHLC